MNMHDNINELTDELGMSRKNFVSEIARGLDNTEKCQHILSVLENYDILVLQEVQENMKRYKNSLFDLVVKRRENYIDSVRAKSKYNRSSLFNFCTGDSVADSPVCSDDMEIDLSRDQDDTQNLAYGMTVISDGIRKIDVIIYKKQVLIDKEENYLEKLRWASFLSTSVVIFTLAHIINIYNGL